MKSVLSPAAAMNIYEICPGTRPGQHWPKSNATFRLVTRLLGICDAVYLRVIMDALFNRKSSLSYGLTRRTVDRPSCKRLIDIYVSNVNDARCDFNMKFITIIHRPEAQMSGASKLLL